MISSNIEEAVILLNDGEVVAFPTETVYGLGAIAFNANAVAKIFERKGRPHFDPLIVHAATTDRAFALCANVTKIAERLAEAFWPGPITLVLPKIESIPDIVTAGLPSVALRVPAHPVAQALLMAVNAPLAAPSANRFGKVSPTTAEHVLQDLGSRVPLILEGGPCQRGVESTIISLMDEHPRLLRPGSIALEEICAIIGPIQAPDANGDIRLSPGQLKSHYAPSTPMQPLSDALPPGKGERVGLLALTSPSIAGYAAIEVLTEAGDLREAATHLFAALRRLDAQQLDRIVCEYAPAHGLGLAINDRLSRGCQPKQTELREPPAPK